MEESFPICKVLYSIPERMKLNEWGLMGEWVIGKENATLNQRKG